jgi:hypothetical protein
MTAYGAASLVLLLTDAAVNGASAELRWLRTLAGYGISPSQAGQGPSALTQSGLAGLPGIFPAGAAGPAAVTLAVLLLVAVFVVFLPPSRMRQVVGADPQLALALAVTAALAIMPFSHLNDLVLAAAPLVYLAGRPPTAASRVLFGLWALAIPLNLAASSVLHRISSATGWAQQAGYGVVLTIALAIAMVSAGRYGLEASQRK